MDRRLSAILAADVVGYSRLMGVDEVGTLDRLKALRRELVEPAIRAEGGRVVKLMGDGLLAEFSSVVGAVRAAVAVQAEMPAREAGEAEIRRLRLRIGISLGDIIALGSDIYGDGVNLAARLEALADPGGLCVSGPVHDTVSGKLDAAFEDIGFQELKNLPKPVQVWRLVGEHIPSPVTSPPADLRELASKPGIAILPFKNLSGDPDQEYFSDGITEDIITELSRYGEFVVIARNSSFAFKGQSRSMREIAGALGVRYLAEGSVRRSGNRIRVAAQLVDAETEGHVWADRFDRELTDIFAVQDEITRAIATAVGCVVTDAETRRAMRMAPSSVAAYDQFLRAWEIGLQITKEQRQRAVGEAERALKLDPDYARPYAALSLFYVSSVWNGWAEDSAAALRKGRDFALKAVALDPFDPWAHTFLGISELWRGDHDRALAETAKAFELNPNFADGYAWHASVLDYSGEPRRALEHVAVAHRLNPRAPIWYRAIEARALFGAGDFRETIRASSEVLAERPNFTTALGICAASHAAVSEAEEARALVDRVIANAPTYRLRNLGKILPYKRDQDRESFLHWLRVAGLPD